MKADFFERAKISAHCARYPPVRGGASEADEGAAPSLRPYIVIHTVDGRGRWPFKFPFESSLLLLVGRQSFGRSAHLFLPLSTLPLLLRRSRRRPADLLFLVYSASVRIML